MEVKMEGRQWLGIVGKGLVMILLALVFISLGTRLVRPATALFVPKAQFFATSYSGGTFEIDMQQKRERAAYEVRIEEVSKLVGPIVYFLLGMLYVYPLSAIWRHRGTASS